MEVVVTRRAVERARAGHLWIYKSDVRESGNENSNDAAVVRVTDERGRFVAHALWSATSQISLRLLTTRDEIVNRDFWQRRLHAALARRAHLEGETDAYRLVFSEGDLMPSLIVDKYRDVLVLQTLSRGVERLKAMFVELLIERVKPRLIIERNDVRVRGLEGLPLSAGVIYKRDDVTDGEAHGEFVINQHGVKFAVAPLGGQKTGAFLDQRENHRRAADFARGHALDCFTFNGGFALNIVRSCESVIGLDVSGEAVAACRHNATLNGMTNVEFREANVFDALREMETAGTRFDTIILDPPAFAKNHKSVEGAIRGYKEINLRAMKLLNAGGILVTCTCSYHVAENDFLNIITDAGSDARRHIQVIEKRTQANDHPILLGMPETYYLKCLICRVL